ncbi:MAG TPA: MFS transporter, partial [Acetobacteraceae bacterium]|nr:MFS transporter [Acetobacteraceae bacterium]
MPDTFEEAVKQPEIDVAPADRAKRRGRTLILAACLMATFVTATESTIVATAMPTIVGDLGGFDLFSWVFTIFLLAQAVSIPIYGRLADMFGRKKVFFIGIGLFLTGSILCGFSWAMVPLICFRALQGLGAGAIQPITATILGDIYTPSER